MRRARPLLGTFVDIDAEGLPEAALDRAIEAAFAAVSLVQRLMSFHDERSELTKLNRCASYEAVKVHPWTTRVMRAALFIYHATDGLFDCAIGHELVDWQLLPHHGHGRGRSGCFSEVVVLPDARIAYRSNVLVDLGGIAKGFAVDIAIATLRRHGVRAATVNAGGDLRVMGIDPQPIYIRAPGNDGALVPVGLLRNGAIATSAATATLAESAGRTISALVAKTRQPIVDDASFSVIAKTCLIADALTKALAQVRRTDAPYFRRFGATALINGTDQPSLQVA